MEYQAPSIEKRQSVVALMTKGVHPHTHPNHATLVSGNSDSGSGDVSDQTLH